MKTIELYVNDSKRLRFQLKFNLDTLELTIQRRLSQKSYEWINDYYVKHDGITKDTVLHDILLDAFDNYLLKKDIELFWVKELNDTSIVEIREGEKTETGDLLLGNPNDSGSTKTII